ncbi:hypothetical protein CTRI78_v005899 [Colletotrichum trifolii]|uniref:Uncharacterized protein n=1 Tax=Colletotrichum trifolii TaxID=5466 RepID=A0A4R8RDV1_COLTR|nr:hypothetical protein CTRI78_v005899 [Colletotrichum trifolii]
MANLGPCLAKPKQTNDAESSRDVGLDRAKLNGTLAVDDLENKHITGIEDQINSADVSVSGGSDTEASRAGRDGDKGHGRTSSTVKKPATFKAVSVNKTFLAAKGASTISAKPADKTSSSSMLSSSPSGTSALSGSRPRLVAKTGSGAGNAPRLTSTANGGTTSSGPDPSAVWNKNRPVPAPEPKKFTDEELKKYGIHMANRLAPESSQGQGNWADIEDDDDDWAPETITWGDGTKTTLPHPDETPAPPPEPPAPISAPAPAPAPPKEKLFVEKPKSPAPPRSTASPSMKPGVLASGKGLVLKGGSADKPTLVAKPPAPPTPVKSPWATLPPVEKAPPVVAEQPAPQPGHRFAARDQAGKSNTPPPYAREIAADDFNRNAWREGQNQTGGNRELFNSQSGRYEPVNDRRGSFRSDTHNRQPPLLQRPSQSDHPEPSAAFQTSRTTAPEGPFGRRRGSSNVSGGSGTYLQRISKGHEQPLPPPELLNPRRGSVAGSVDGPMSPRNFSPSGLQHGPRAHPNQSWQPRASPGQNYANLHSAGPPPDGRPVQPPPMARLEEDIELQKKIMREKRELAMQRRREEEAREEAARRERIKAKLDAMGPPPERKSAKKEPTETANATLQREDSAGSDAVSQSKESANDAGLSTVPTALTNITEKPFVERAAGEPDHRRPAGHDARQPSGWEGQAPQQDRIPTWGGAGAQQSVRNVWGSPNNDRGLGNGTFITDIGRLPDGPGGQLPPVQSKKGPAPIAPPSAQRASSQAPPTNPGRSGSTRELTDMRNKWASAVLDGDKAVFDERKTQRLERDRELNERGLTAEQAQPNIKETWRPAGEGRREPAHVVHHDIASSAATASVLPPTGPAASHPRPSRFFPPKDSRHDSASAVEPSRPNSPSPPPPDMMGHPAFDGDVNHPHVSLPRPQPVVKLPPSLSGSATQATRSGGSFAWATPSGYKDVPGAHRGVHSQSAVPQRQQSRDPASQWQDRINKLVGKPTSPPRASGVEPVSKSALDYSGLYDPATVSLPGVSHEAVDDVKSFTTKPMAEECFEEQEMGSLPQIRLPHKTPDAAWHPAQAPAKPLPRRFWVSDIESVRALWFPHEISSRGSVYRIYFPGMTEARTVLLPYQRSTSNPRGSNSRGRNGTGPSRGGKGRESSYGESSGSAPPTRGRGGYRGRGSENWSRRGPASQAA